MCQLSRIGGEFRVLRNRLPEINDTLLQSVIGSLIPEVTPLQISLVYLGLDGMQIGWPRVSWRGNHFSLYFFRNITGTRALQNQHVFEIVIETSRLQMTITGRIDQLHPNPNPASDALHGPLNQSIHAKVTANLRSCYARALVVRDRGPRNHPQASELGEIHGEFVGHPIRKILLV